MDAVSLELPLLEAGVESGEAWDVGGNAVSEFGLVRSFSIDDGQLDGLTPQTCFVLGYELAEIDIGLTLPNRISRPIHVENRERIEEACKKSKRRYVITWLAGDRSESWLQLDVEEER